MKAAWIVNVALIAAMFCAGLYLRAQNATAEQALCALRSDLEVRVDRSIDYLADLDAGRRDPIPGISRADIVRSIQGQRDTIHALGNLKCE